MYGLHSLLWHIRNDARIAAEYAADPESVLDRYELDPDERDAIRSLDFKALYDKGVNPYLLYFCALQLGVDRERYYEQIRGGRGRAGADHG
jgi:hypothetical protein